MLGISRRFKSTPDVDGAHDAAVSDVALKIAKAFEDGPIRTSYINAQGISEISIRFGNSVVAASWYSQRLGYKLVKVSIDDTSSFESSADAEHIKCAAIRRAQGMLREKLESLRGLD